MTTTPELVTTGEYLTGARASRGLSLEDASHETRIPAGHLRALESGDYEEFDGVAYARGFLRMYGNYLGVDVTDGLALLENRRELAGGVNYYPFLDAPDKVRFASEMRAPRSTSIPLIAILLGMLAVMVVPAGFLVARHYRALQEERAAQSVADGDSENSATREPDAAGAPAASGEGERTAEEEEIAPASSLDDIVRVPKERLKRIRDHAAPEVRRAELAEEPSGEGSQEEPASEEAEATEGADDV